tara:strand:+ start:187437 stop:189236 length:1800 start_codon:yes stop_codon:yes gene_type:complete
LISKSLSYIFVIFLVLSGCSSPEKNKEVAVSEGLKKEVSKEVKKEVIHYGPHSSKANSFIDVTKNLGLGARSATHFYSVDWSGDGHTDLVYLPFHYSVPVFLKYSPKYKKYSPIDYNPFGKVVRGSYLIFLDIDKDSVLDCIVGTLNQKTELEKEHIRIYKGKLGSQYQLIEQKTGINEVKPASSIIPFDYNLDGKIDLFVTSWYDFTKKASRPALVPDQIFMGEGNGFKFRNASYLLKDENEFKRSEKEYPNAVASFGGSVCDIDQDGYPDLLSASSNGMPNRMWMNRYDNKNKDRIFINYASEANTEADDEGKFDKRGGGNSFYMNCADYNHDGIMDIAVGELFHSYDNEKKDRSSILTGSQFAFPPKFIRTEYNKDDGSGSWSQGDRRANWIDINTDGFLDLLVDNSGFPPKSRLIYFEQSKDHSFDDTADTHGINLTNPSGTVIVDWNRDGMPDILTGQTNVRDSKIEPRIYALQNNLKKGRRFRVILRGIKSNYHGIGGTIKVITNQRKILRPVSIVSGNLPSQGEEGEFISLFNGEDILKIEVLWPILVNKNGTSKVLKKTYQKSLRPFVGKKLIVLCENGRVYGDRIKSCKQ